MKCLLLCFLLLSSGCAQAMVLKQPGQVDESVVAQGVSRTRVWSELGAPIWTHADGDDLRDTFRYQDGGTVNTALWKTFRVLVYTAGDVLFLFLTQVIWIPMELMIEPHSETVTVTYRGESGRWVVDRASGSLFVGQLVGAAAP